VNRPRERRLRDTPGWVLIAIAILAGMLIVLGVFAVANYTADQTTVTIDEMVWEFTYAQGATGYLPICGFGGGEFSSCPVRAPPGSDYTGSLLISGYFAGKNVSLSAPSPFRLISTNPTLPVLVTPSGLDITFELQLPTSAGEYSFIGSLTFS
jgi:hypothetical protein